MLFIPANSSSSAFIQALADNEFKGIIFETEADTLANTFKQEWGNFSDVLRKAFHHENASLYRRKDEEFIEIEDPRLAIALSGTPQQVRNMMPDVENGLFSRFLYYAFRDHGDFRNPFEAPRRMDYLRHFRMQGQRIYDLHQKLGALKKSIPFSLSTEQASSFTAEFNRRLKRSKLLLGDDFEASIKRLGLIAFRLAMTLSALQLVGKGETPISLICTDQDFSTALTITSTLEKHAVAVYRNLPRKVLKGIRQIFFEALPESFNRQTYLSTAQTLGIGKRHADKLIREMKSQMLRHNNYKYNKKHLP
jgi:hypothetical protein